MQSECSGLICCENIYGFIIQNFVLLTFNFQINKYVLIFQAKHTYGYTYECVSLKHKGKITDDKLRGVSEEEMKM